MDTEMKQEAVSAENETTHRQIEIQVGPIHVLSLLFLLGAAVFVAGFGWWTLSGTVDFSELRATLLAEPGQGANPAAGPAPARLAVPTAPSARQPAPRAEPRQMALPPVRKGFQPEPEDTAVKGDPNAPVTIVEYSDYQ